ncbi:MAG: hypothetical protein K2K48_00840 [Anaeroplasmataceae bacterium]|nr:hypothetical protein [Anaeroplasmataceae bacterium]
MEKIKRLIDKKLIAASKYKRNRAKVLLQKYEEIYLEYKNQNMKEEEIIENISISIDDEIRAYECCSKFSFLLCASIAMQCASILEIALCNTSFSFYIMPIMIVGLILGFIYKKNRNLFDYLSLIFILTGLYASITRIFYFGEYIRNPYNYSRNTQFIFPCIFQVNIFEVATTLLLGRVNLLNLNWLVSFIMMIISGSLYFLERKHKLAIREEGTNYGMLAIMSFTLFGCSIIESLSFLFQKQGLWVTVFFMSLAIVGLIAFLISSIFVKKIKLGTILFTILFLGVWITSLCHFLVISHPYGNNADTFIQYFSLMTYRVNGASSTIHYSLYLNFIVSISMSVIFGRRYSQTLTKSDSLD